MKKVCLFLVYVMLLGLLSCTTVPVSAAADDSAFFVLDDFSAGEISAPLNGKITATWVEEGVGVAKGAAHLTPQANYASLNYDFGARKGYTYDISAWIKVDETPLLDEVRFVIYNADAETEERSLYNMVTVKNAGLVKDKWVKVSGVFQCNGKGHQVGGGDYDTIPKGSLQIRIGDGVPANTMASGIISYTIDDITVIPRENISPVITDKNLITNGSFEAADYLEGWRYNKNSTQVTEIAGANGTASATNITVKADWGAIFQDDVDIRYGRKYKISFWAKATSEEAVGLPIEFILSRTAGMGKVDEAIPNYEYVTDPDDTKLSAEWKLFEMTYFKNIRTADTIKPNFCFRVGEGKEHLSYAVDELEIYEEPITGVLQSTGRISGAPKFGSVYGYMATAGGLAQNCITRILAPFNGDYAIIYSATDVVNEFNLPMRAGMDYESLEFVATSVDYEGNVGAVFRKTYQMPESITVTAAEFNETIWNDEIPSLTANVSYISEKSSGALFAYVGYYGANNQLLSVHGNAVAISESGVGKVEVSAPNQKNAVKAKLFLWEDGTASPVREYTQIEKAKAGRFIYVDPVKGTNNLTGSYAKPLKSFFQAKSLLKRELKNATEDFYVILMPGEYAITSTQELTTAECSDKVNVTYTSYNKNNKAEFTGGKNISGTFQLYDSTKNIYRAKVADGTESRQLFVNGVRAVKAKNNGPLTNAVNMKMDENNNLITAAEAKKITAAGGMVTDIGIKTSDTFLKDYKRIDDIELVFYEQWTNPRCQVASITDNGDGTILLVMDAVGWKAMSNKGGTATTVPVYIENALELLDEEGEWYLDTVDDYVYYKPRFFEDISTADIVLPTTEKLFTITGTSVSAPIKNIRFDNVEFTETTWMRPSTENGHSDAQNNHIRQNGDRLPDAAVEVTNAHNVDFTNCDFNRLGITGLRMIGAIQDCDVVGNEFYELGGTAVSLGGISGSNVVNPTDEAYFIINNNICNNYIHNFGVEFKSAAAISAGFPKNTNISQNEIFCGAYSGMHIGYGWDSYDATGTGTENLHITKNYIHNVLNDNLYDGGGIYTLGATGGTRENPNLISENYFEDIGNMHGAIYPDEGSTFWKINKNVVDMSMNTEWTGKLGSHKTVPIWIHIWTASIHDIILEDNYSTTSNYRNNGTDIAYEDAILPTLDGWQPEAQSVVDNSGVAEAYLQNFKYGFQRAEVAESVTLQKGHTVKNEPMCFTRKGNLYPKGVLEAYASSSNPAVATVTDNVITAHSPGETVITYYFIEQGIMKTAETVVTVTE